MDMYNIFCPYCGNAHDPHNYYVDGFQVIVCDGCSKPFVNQTTTTPVFHSFALVGFEEMPVYPHPAHEDVGEIIEKALRPALRQFVDSAYPTPEEIEQAIQEDPEEQLCVDCGKPISTNSVFRQCPMSKNTTYRLDGDHVEVKYKKSTPVTTTRSDIHLLCEEDNPTSSIKELLGADANTNKVAALNAVVRAVNAGLIEI